MSQEGSITSLCSLLWGESSHQPLGRRRMLQVSSVLHHSNASALALETLLYSECSCSVALELGQGKQQETRFRFPTFYLYLYTQSKQSH